MLALIICQPGRWHGKCDYWVNNSFKKVSTGKGTDGNRFSAYEARYNEVSSNY
jgi:hypothetical protein